MDAIRVPIKVVPSASRDGIAGWLGDELKVRVRAPAERGRANSAAVRLVAEALGLPTRRVRLVRGRTSARKILEITGVAGPELRRRLG